MKARNKAKSEGKYQISETVDRGVAENDTHENSGKKQRIYQTHVCVLTTRQCSENTPTLKELTGIFLIFTIYYPFSLSRHKYFFGSF